MSKLLSDILSWYWWVSVVVVGLVINLASAYMKAPLDAWLANRSNLVRHKKEEQARQFQEEVTLLSSDSTLLILAGQRLLGAQVVSLAVLVFAALVVSLGFAGGAQVSGWRLALQWVSVCGMYFLLVVLFVLMRWMERLADKVGSARKVYQAKFESPPGTVSNGGRP